MGYTDKKEYVKFPMEFLKPNYEWYLQEILNKLKEINEKLEKK